MLPASQLCGRGMATHNEELGLQRSHDLRRSALQRRLIGGMGTAPRALPQHARDRRRDNLARRLDPLRVIATSYPGDRTKQEHPLKARPCEKG
jgi:hypothetical protein